MFDLSTLFKFGSLSTFLMPLLGLIGCPIVGCQYSKVGAGGWQMDIGTQFVMRYDDKVEKQSEGVKHEVKLSVAKEFIRPVTGWIWEILGGKDSAEAEAEAEADIDTPTDDVTFNYDSSGKLFNVGLRNKPERNRRIKAYTNNDRHSYSRRSRINNRNVVSFSQFNRTI